MKVYGLIILLCLSLLFVSRCDDAQAVTSNSQNNFNDPKFGGTVNQTPHSNDTLSNQTASPNQTLSMQTLLSVTKTLGMPTAHLNKTLAIHTPPSNKTLAIHTSPSNKTSTKQTPSNKIPSKQASQLLEKQFLTDGNALFDQGNYTEAITYFDKALILNSTDINALYNKALSLDNLGRLDEAITYYDKVLAIHPNDTDALSNTGLALDGLGEHDKAITYYDKVLAINPSDTDALYNKGLALEELGQKNNAALYYKKVLEVNPNDTSALNKLNLTFNNANKTVTVGVQKVDQTLQIVVGVFIAILIGIIAIDRVAKRTGHKSGAKVLTKSDLEEVDQTVDEKSKEIDEDEWKGV